MDYDNYQLSASPLPIDNIARSVAELWELRQISSPAPDR